jgi:hypothetical protein
MPSSLRIYAAIVARLVDGADGKPSVVVYATRSETVWIISCCRAGEKGRRHDAKKKPDPFMIDGENPPLGKAFSKNARPAREVIPPKFFEAVETERKKPGRPPAAVIKGSS